jgi:glycosyltransferase involved in cell wall biosynthesis
MTHPDPLTLVLVGRVEIPIPGRPDIVSVGFVSDEDKFNAMAGAEVFLLPSKLESLSFVFLESLGLGTPAVRMEPRVLGLAAELKHGTGIPYRKIEDVVYA